MKNLATFLLLLFLLPFASFGQSFSSTEILSQPFDQYFEGKNKDEFTTLFVVPNADSYTITNGEEFGVKMDKGVNLVVFIPTNVDFNGVFKLVKKDGEEITVDGSSPFPLSEFQTLKLYQNGKLLYTYNF